MRLLRIQDSLVRMSSKFVQKNAGAQDWPIRVVPQAERLPCHANIRPRIQHEEKPRHIHIKHTVFSFIWRKQGN